MPRDLADLAASAARFADALPAAQKKGVSKSALFVTTSIRTEIRKVTGDMRLSGIGRAGARVGASYDVKGTKNPTALIKGVGPLHLVENNTSPHTIGPRRRRKKKALKFGGRFAARVEHPGTRGQKPFKKGWTQAGPHTPRIFQQEVHEALEKSWL